MKLVILMNLLLFSLQSFGETSATEAKALQPEAMKLWEKRYDKATLEECLAKFEKIREGMPENTEILELLARGYFLLGELSQNHDEKMKVYAKSRDYGMAGMSLNPEFQKLADKDIEKAVKTLTIKEVPFAFWTAAALGRWSKLNGVMSSLKYKDRMLAMIAKVEELQPDYFHGAPLRFWGGFYAVAPGFVGGDMKKSKKYFDDVMKKFPEYVGSKVAYAELYLVEKDDEKEFKKVLEEVIAAPLPPNKDIEPENMLEKKKAEILLSKIKEIF